MSDFECAIDAIVVRNGDKVHAGSLGSFVNFAGFSVALCGTNSSEEPFTRAVRESAMNVEICSGRLLA